VSHHRSLHWRLIKQTVGQLSLTASVADIDVAKAAATASTKGKRIVREDVTMSLDKSEGKDALHLYVLKTALYGDVGEPSLSEIPVWTDVPAIPANCHLRYHLPKQVQCQVHCHPTRSTPSCRHQGPNPTLNG
jgi:hypothetical protein